MGSKAASWAIPVASFGLALALSVLAGGTSRMLIARQSGQQTGNCTCNLKIVEVTDSFSWTTTTAKDLILKTIAINHSVTVCASSKPEGLAWQAQYTAGNLSVAYVAKITGFPDVIVPGAVIPIPYLKLTGTCPCLPAQETKSTSHPVHLPALHTGAIAAIKAQLAPNYPKGTPIDVNVTSISFSASDYNPILKLTGGCSPPPAGFGAADAAFVSPKNAAQGSFGPVTTIVSQGCP